jgi:hypothetical protein
LPAEPTVDTTFHFGFIIGPSIGGLMIDYFSWRWSFFLLAPIGFGGMLLALANMKRRAAEPRRVALSIDYLGAALLFANTTILVFIFDRRTQQMTGGAAKTVLVAALVAGLAWFIVHESRAKSPFVDLTLFKIRRFAFSVVSLLIGGLLRGDRFLCRSTCRMFCCRPSDRHPFHGAVNLDRRGGAPAAPVRRVDPRFGPLGVVFMIRARRRRSAARRLAVPAGAVDRRERHTNGIFNPANSRQ